MDDVRAVLDAAELPSPVLLASHDGCAWRMLFAATYPERTAALALFHPLARSAGAGRPWATRLTTASQLACRDELGDAGVLRRAPGHGLPDALRIPARARQWFANELRVGPAPSSRTRSTGRSRDRHADGAAAIKAPTLVFYREGSVEAEQHRDVAARIEDAHAVRRLRLRLRGIFLRRRSCDEVERFVGGAARGRVPDSVLATVLFTDIVGSTERAAELGDRGWRELLERHHALVRRELTRFRGEEKDTAGDGFFATFDGPARAIRCAGDRPSRSASSGSSCVRASTRASASSTTTKSPGIAVSIGARVAAAARPGEVLVSQTVKDLVAGSGIDFDDRGEHELKGVPGAEAGGLYAVTWAKWLHAVRRAHLGHTREVFRAQPPGGDRADRARSAREPSLPARRRRGEAPAQLADVLADRAAGRLRPRRRAAADHVPRRRGIEERALGNGAVRTSTTTTDACRADPRGRVGRRLATMAGHPVRIVRPGEPGQLRRRR